nr:MAG TPA: helix-turn-helix domain protein [Caudoviricetes sp.]
MQYNGKSSIAVARTMNCSVMTLYRGYKACGLPPPFAQRYSDDDVEDDAEEEDHK